MFFARPPSLLTEREPSAYTPAIRDSLSIPATFGNIFSGETLRCCVSMSNGSPNDATQVSLKAELHATAGAVTASTRRATLLDTTEQPAQRLPGGERIDFFVSTPLSEPGPHVLVCTVAYTRQVPQRSIAIGSGQADTFPTGIATGAMIDEKKSFRK